MKKRDYTDIGVFKNPDDALTFKHLVGEMTVSCQGGAAVLPIPCGGGKSTGIADLIRQFQAEGVLLLVKTRRECDEAREKIIANGVAEKDVAMLYDGSLDATGYEGDPDSITMKRVIITPSINLYRGYLPALLTYDAGKRVDTKPYIGDVTKLLTSSTTRKYILIDEQPDFIQPFIEFSRPKILSVFGYIKKTAKNGISLGSGSYLHCMSPQDMETIYAKFTGKTSDRFYGTKSKLNDYRTDECLYYIRDHFTQLGSIKHDRVPVYHWLKELHVKKMSPNIYIFDATGDVLSEYKRTGFQLARNTDTCYSSDIEFEEFPMNVERWLFEDGIDESFIIERIVDIVDELERQINSIAGKLLVVTWKYMAARNSNPEQEDKHFDIISILEQQLDSRGLGGRYSIIYRGSGQDKATNAFSDFSGITFLGEWRTGKSTLKLLNKNYGIQTSERRLRLAAMIQTVCRIRIRKHEGQKIWIFYSDDIDRKLIRDMFFYFKEKSDPAVVVSGVAMLPKENGRTFGFIEKVRKLCTYDPGLIQAIKESRGYTLKIPLGTLHSLIPLKEKKTRAYQRSLGKRLREEYSVTLDVV